ncbi:type II toxin-antitoxin system death-on-curing family toxin [Labedella populi]|uniref:Type II toxin-antitoxin system death-on-curing family toxin n=1 Tax=Labedella populi TaxID=2498850 RepID=A0A444QER7_9MICO|nr:type II toxin-antitoxin system death-on-curing family toxin [Labedella populi]RWZ68107.1 type II toxin-antitoxin system death-on-curing family toxin [Labedella populi]
MIYLSLRDLQRIAERTIGPDVRIRDAGLLESACARPQTTVLGADAYPTLAEKAAALVHSLAKNHPLVDGNKRLALAGLIVFLGVNGRRLTWSNDEAYDFIVDVAEGRVDEVTPMAARIEEGSVDR